MDESNATGVPESIDPRHRVKKYAISIGVESTMSGKHLCGLLFDVLSKRGHVVSRIAVREDAPLLAGYTRNREEQR